MTDGFSDSHDIDPHALRAIVQTWTQALTQPLLARSLDCLAFPVGFGASGPGAGHEVLLLSHTGEVTRSGAGECPPSVMLRWRAAPRPPLAGCSPLAAVSTGVLCVTGPVGEAADIVRFMTLAGLEACDLGTGEELASCGSFRYCESDAGFPAILAGDLMMDQMLLVACVLAALSPRARRRELGSIESALGGIDVMARRRRTRLAVSLADLAVGNSDHVRERAHLG